MEIFSQLWNSIIIQPMINSLLILYSIAISNFGLAIILFTILIRAVMMPLTVKQSKQMKSMTALQPKIKEIQNKFKNDKQKQSQETMKLYKEQGVNPIGCLGPMFIQFPIWIGLYQAILQTVPNTPESLVNLSGHLYGWLPFVHDVVPINSQFIWMDLANPDPSPVVMPLLVGISMFLMQKMTTMPAMDDRQASTNKMMLWMMPIMFGFFTMQFPSGLALYWVVSNLVGIVIQGFITGWDPLKNLLSFARNRTLRPAAA
ncbi:MAG: membrane protein insertase YidC, partial [SAR202 cluster bacterium]|nr:membrane protein insertase YidC [SAR202 cluster bacterium]